MRRALSYVRRRVSLFLLLILALVVGSALNEPGNGRWLALAVAAGVIIFTLLPDGRPSRFRSLALFAAMFATYLGGGAYFAYKAVTVNSIGATDLLFAVPFALVYGYIFLLLLRAFAAEQRLAKTGVYEHYKKRPKVSDS